MTANILTRLNANLKITLVFVRVMSIAFHDVVYPFTLVNVAVGKFKGAPTPAMVMFPFPCVLCEGFPFHVTETSSNRIKMFVKI